MDKEGEKQGINGEDTTKYGEFISSYFNWITLKKQKEVTKKLENVTNDEKTEEQS